MMNAIFVLLSQQNRSPMRHFDYQFCFQTHYKTQEKWASPKTTERRLNKQNIIYTQCGNDSTIIVYSTVIHEQSKSRSPHNQDSVCYGSTKLFCKKNLNTYMFIIYGLHSNNVNNILRVSEKKEAQLENRNKASITKTNRNTIRAQLDCGLHKTKKTADQTRIFFFQKIEQDSRECS